MLTLSEGHCEGKSGAMVSIVEDMEIPLMELKKEVILFRHGYLDCGCMHPNILTIFLAFCSLLELP